MACIFVSKVDSRKLAGSGNSYFRRYKICLSVSTDTSNLSPVKENIETNRNRDGIKLLPP